MSMIKFAGVFFIIFLQINCNNDSKVKPLGKKIDKEIYDLIMKECLSFTHKKVLVYYMDGDCSICIGKAKELESNNEYSKDETKFVLMAVTNNINLFKNNMLVAKFRSCVIIDQSREYNTYLPLHSVTTIDEDKNIINQIVNY